MSSVWEVIDYFGRPNQLYFICWLLLACEHLARQGTSVRDFWWFDRWALGTRDEWVGRWGLWILGCAWSLGSGACSNLSAGLRSSAVAQLLHQSQQSSYRWDWAWPSFHKSIVACNVSSSPKANLTLPEYLKWLLGSIHRKWTHSHRFADLPSTTLPVFGNSPSPRACLFYYAPSITS